MSYASEVYFCHGMRQMGEIGSCGGLDKIFGNPRGNLCGLGHNTVLAAQDVNAAHESVICTGRWSLNGTSRL